MYAPYLTDAECQTYLNTLLNHIDSTTYTPPYKHPRSNLQHALWFTITNNTKNLRNISEKIIQAIEHESNQRILQEFHDITLPSVAYDRDQWNDLAKTIHTHANTGLHSDNKIDSLCDIIELLQCNQYVPMSWLIIWAKYNINNTSNDIFHPVDVTCMLNDIISAFNYNDHIIVITKDNQFVDTNGTLYLHDNVSDILNDLAPECMCNIDGWDD